MDTEIDYITLGNALKFYKSNGYTQIEVPWTVPLQDIMITCPKEEWATKAIGLDGYLVGSAEQSFLSLLRKGLLDYKKKYVACTPCFRTNESDEWHQPYFMKIELFRGIPYNSSKDWIEEKIIENILLETIKIAKCFFQFYEPMISDISTQKSRIVDIVKTKEGFDIELNGIELGSYGFRENIEYKLAWIYGTGIAEPRFSKAINYDL